MRGKSAWGEIQFGSADRGLHHSVLCDHSVGLGTDFPLGEKLNKFPMADEKS